MMRLPPPPTVKVPVKRSTPPRTVKPVAHVEPYDFGMGSEGAKSLSVLPISDSADGASDYLEALRMPLIRRGDKPSRDGSVVWVLRRRGNERLSEARVLGHFVFQTGGGGAPVELLGHAKLFKDLHCHRYYVESARMSCLDLGVDVRPIDLTAVLAPNLKQFMKSFSGYPSWELPPDSTLRVTVSIALHCGKIECFEAESVEKSGDFLIRFKILSGSDGIRSADFVMSQFVCNVDKRKWSDFDVVRLPTYKPIEIKVDKK